MTDQWTAFQYFLWIILGTILIIGLWIIFGMLMHPVNAQTPPSNQVKTPPTSTPPATTAPTVTNTPTPTTPLPNLQYLPQKAYVQSYAPEIGIPSNTAPLQALPPVIAPPAQQPAAQSILGGLDFLVPTLIAAGTGVMAKMGLDKAKKAQGTVQEVAQTQVKQVAVQQKGLELQYETMGPEKANSITDKPEIKLAEVAKLKEEALNTASKA